MFSYIKLVEKIPSVHFVVINLKLLFIYFVNVIKLNQSDRNFKILLIQNATLIMTSIIWINYLVSLKNVGSRIFCCVVKFIFTAVNFKMIHQALLFLNLFLLLNVIWNIIMLRKNDKLSLHFKKWCFDLNWLIVTHMWNYVCNLYMFGNFLVKVICAAYDTDFFFFFF